VRSPPDFDAAVVGAGPAGCAAAIACAAAGRRVAIVERAAFPRDRCGETLHPGAEPILRALGVLDTVLSAGFLRHEGIRVRWRGSARFQPYGDDAAGPWRGLQAWRPDLDAILLDRARRRGAVVLQPCRALHPLQDDGGRVTGVCTTAGDVTARWTLDAGGGGHWVTRALRLELERRSPPLVARYGYAVGKLPELRRGPELNAEPGGWTWIAQVRPQLVHWTRLALAADARSHDEPPLRLRQLRADGGVRGADVSWRATRRAAGPGYLALGDAAAVLDPASSHGVLRALMSGMAAAAVVREGPGPQPRGDLFARLLRSWFELDVERLRMLYAELPRPPPWLAAPTATRSA